MTDVDVVISCHDQGDLVLAAVASARAQTRPPRAVVIVDDGSTDPVTLATLRSLEDTPAGSAGDPRAVVIRTPNRHVSAARNTGIAAANSPYVCVLDADDRIEPEFLATTCAALETDRRVVAASSWLLSYGLGDWLIRPGGGDVTRFLARNSCPATITVRRADWASAGGYCEDMTAGYEDWDFCLRLLTGGGRIEVEPRPLIRYRTAAGSLNLTGFGARAALVGEIVDRHPELFVRHLRELVVQKEEIAVERLAALVEVFGAHPELDPGPVGYGDGGIAARVLIESRRSSQRSSSTAGSAREM